MILNVYSSIYRFKKGLVVLGVLDAVQNSSSEMRDAFVHTASPLDATTVEGIFVVPKWSELGSNLYQDEKRIFTYWCDFLQDAEGEIFVFL